MHTKPMNILIVFIMKIGTENCVHGTYEYLNCIHNEGNGIHEGLSTTSCVYRD